jgi:CRISPR system Cascade subunit CasB
LTTTKSLEAKDFKEAKLFPLFLRWVKDHTEQSKKEESARKAERAILRRCSSPEALFYQESFHGWLASLERQGIEIPRSKGLHAATMIGILVHVEEHTAEDLPVHLGTTKSDEEKPLLSPQRFQRILQIEDKDLDSLYLHIRRALQMTNRRANTANLARDIFFWNQNTKRRWAEKYYQTMFS